MKKRRFMNEYQEALKNIRPIICELVSIGTHDGTEREYKYIDSEEYILLHILVDKETPMKPTLKRGIYDIRCSKCGNPILNTKWTYGRYCSGCGQKIDWSDEK